VEELLDLAGISWLRGIGRVYVLSVLGNCWPLCRRRIRGSAMVSVVAEGLRIGVLARCRGVGEFT